MDELILELRLSPLDAFYKMQHVLESVNNAVSSADISGRCESLSTKKGNVMFASSEYDCHMT